MARTLIVPDIHNHTGTVDEILARQCYDAVVFLGDYFDDFNDTPAHARRTAQWLKAHLSEPRFTFLYGNHDLPYRFPSAGLDRPGFTIDRWRAIVQVLGESDWERIRLHTWVDGWLLTHAGWNEYFAHPERGNTRERIDELCAECLEQLENGRMHDLVAAGRSRGGRAAAGGLTWQDWGELRPIRGLHQVVGHTPSLDIRRKGDADGSAICLDTRLCYAGILEDGAFTERTTHVWTKWLGPGGRLSSR